MAKHQLAVLLVAASLYGLHALLTIVWIFRPREPGRVGRWAVVIAALALHTWFLLTRGIEVRSLPVDTRLDSAALFLWITAGVWLLSSMPYRLRLAAPFFWPIYALGMIGAVMWAGREPASDTSLNRLWCVLHLIPIYAGYASFAVGTGAGLAYLMQERLLRRKSPSALWRRLPSLETLERVGRSALPLGFPFLTVGLIVGCIWAEQNPALLGPMWYRDPKVVGGVLFWLFYAGILHIRLFAKARGRRAALLTIFGFCLALTTFAAVHVYVTVK